MSPSNNPTRAPAAASAAAIFTAIVDLPTPPFPLPTARILRTPESSVLSSCGACRTSAVILTSTASTPGKLFTRATASSRILSFTGHAGVVRFRSNETFPVSIFKFRIKPSDTMSLRKSGSWTRFKTFKTCASVTVGFLSSLFQKAIYLNTFSWSLQPLIVAKKGGSPHRSRSSGDVGAAPFKTEKDRFRNQFHPEFVKQAQEDFRSVPKYVVGFVTELFIQHWCTY